MPQETVQSAFARFLSRVSQIEALRQDEAYALYERLKRELGRECPDLAPPEYEVAIRAIARASGI